MKNTCLNPVLNKKETKLSLAKLPSHALPEKFQILNGQKTTINHMSGIHLIGIGSKIPKKAPAHILLTI